MDELKTASERLRVELENQGQELLRFEYNAKYGRTGMYVFVLACPEDDEHRVFLHEDMVPLPTDMANLAELIADTLVATLEART